MPKVDLAAVPLRTGAGYPPPFDAPCAARTRRRLGNAGGLRDFGVNLMSLPERVTSSTRSMVPTRMSSASSAEKGTSGFTAAVANSLIYHLL